MFNENHLLPDKSERKNYSGYSETQGYIIVRKKRHPNASSRGYVSLHRLVMEKEIGRYLTTDEHVHHIDHDKKNNNVENLKIVTMSEHRTIHNFETKKYELSFDVEEMKRLYGKGYSNRKVASILKVGKSTVGFHLKRLGLSRTEKAGKIHVNNPNNKRKITDEEIKEIKKLRKEGVSVKKTCEIIGYSEKTVYRYSKEEN